MKLGTGTQRNNGAGKRIWFLIKDESVPIPHRYYLNARGDLIRYASMQSAQRAANRLNTPCGS